MQDRVQKANGITIQGLILNIGLAALKFFAGVVSNSGAIIADAGHSLSDLSTDIAILWGVNAAARPADQDHQYGHGRIETIVSAGIGIFLFIVGGVIFFEGMRNIVSVIAGRILPRPGWFAFFAAVISLISKEWMYRRTVLIGTETGNQALVVNAWHHRSDALSSLGVMVGIFGAIVLGERGHILDPLTAVVVSGLIMKVAYSVVGGSFNELMEGSLSDDQEKEILDLAYSIEGVRDAHKLRTRRIGHNAAIELHICVREDLDIRQGHDIATNVEDVLKKKFGPGTFISVHIEPFDDGRHQDL